MRDLINHSDRHYAANLAPFQTIREKRSVARFIGLVNRKARRPSMA
jgi:hypothetical protein